MCANRNTANRQAVRTNRAAGHRRVDAALGLGMTRRQLARRIEWPLAFPVAFAGIRTASIEVIASATLAAFIGGGGLGEYITDGLSVDDNGKLLLGAVSVAALALLVDAMLGAIGRRLAGSARGDFGSGEWRRRERG